MATYKIELTQKDIENAIKAHYGGDSVTFTIRQDPSYPSYPGELPSSADRVTATATLSKLPHESINDR